MGLGKSLGAITGGVKNMLFGKKTPGQAGSYTELDPSQRSIIGAYTDELGRLQKQNVMNPELMARAQINQQERLARSGVEDAERQAKSLIAQRGLGKSSIGLSALLGVRSGLGDKINAIRAQQPGMLNDLREQFEANRLNRLGAISGGINQTFGTRMYNAPIAPTGRQGGLLQPILGTAGAVLGYEAGGAQGAAAGYQVGSGLGQGISNIR